MGSQNSSQGAHTDKPADHVAKTISESRFLHDFPQGFMTKSQFIQHYKKVYLSQLPDHEIGNIFDVADVNRDARLSFQEYKALCQILTSGSVQQKLSLTFKLYDADRSQGITRAEIIRMLTSLLKSKGEKDPEVSVKAEANANFIFAHLDKDEDGVLTEGEFIKVASNDALVGLIFGVENCS